MPPAGDERDDWDRPPSGGQVPHEPSYEQRLAVRRKPVSGDVVAPRPRGPELDEGPSPEDVARFSEVTVRCKGCNTELFDDVAVCYKCGRAVLGADSGGIPTWAMIVAAVLVLAILFLVMF